MSVRYKREKESGQYFITFTCYGWIPLIKIVNGYDLIYKWFQFLHGKGHAVNVFVIMPNHVHLILFVHEPEQSLNAIIGSGKRFIAYEIVTRLRKMNREDILSKLSAEVNSSDKKKHQVHRVFEPSFDAKLIYSEKMLHEKIRYIHNNPVEYNPVLSVTPEEYEHSSASFYYSEKSNYFQVVHFRENGEWVENKKSIK